MLVVPAFADGAESWGSLVAELAKTGEVAVVDLPGTAGVPALSEVSLDALAACLVGVVRHLWDEPVTLVGHSLGAVLVGRVADALDGRCRAVVSIEGNLTSDDAYLSGLAAQYDDADAFQQALIAKVQQLVDAGRAPVSYVRSVATADAFSLWQLGRDATEQGVNDGFGEEYRRIACPTLYLWSKDTTPTATQRYLSDHQLPQQQLSVGHHWPWTVDAGLVAKAIHAH